MYQKASNFKLINSLSLSQMEHVLKFIWNNFQSKFKYIREKINYGSNNKNTIYFSISIQYNASTTFKKVLVHNVRGLFPFADDVNKAHWM